MRMEKETQTVTLADWENRHVASNLLLLHPQICRIITCEMFLGAAPTHLANTFKRPVLRLSVENVSESDGFRRAFEYIFDQSRVLV